MKKSKIFGPEKTRTITLPLATNPAIYAKYEYWYSFNGMVGETGILYLKILVLIRDGKIVLGFKDLDGKCYSDEYLTNNSRNPVIRKRRREAIKSGKLDAASYVGFKL